MILDVVTYPNKSLHRVSKEVTKFDDELGKFLDDMYDTMIDKNGIGLAAIQVGVASRILIINLPDKESKEQKKEDLIEIINPKIIKKDGEIVYQEGCLSVPGYYEEVKRAEFILLSYQDRFGKFFQIEAEGLLAVAIQHEMDHLDGHLFIERIGYNKRKKFNKEYKKQKNV